MCTSGTNRAPFGLRPTRSGLAASVRSVEASVQGVPKLSAETRFILGPGGIEPPAHIPPEIFRAAVRTHLAPQRLDLKALALDLEIGRTTLYRKIESRDQLLGEVLWYVARRLLATALEATTGRVGAPRVIDVIRIFMASVEEPPHRRLLEEEPEAAMRILASKEGPVQSGLIGCIERLLQVEEERGAMTLTIERGPLAYAIVRIAESFLYADTIGDLEPDVDRAIEIVAALLVGINPPARPARRTGGR